MEIGAIIKKRRVAMKLTQEELAEKLKFFLQALENGFNLGHVRLGLFGVSAE